MSKIAASDVQIRDVEPTDLPGVLALFRSALGWKEGDPNEAFFTWKHQANAFGKSPAWVATHGGRLIGYRTFLRWVFVDESGRRVSAFRAVDTATHPDYQGLGIFRQLTIRGVAELTRAGEGIIFNTPNNQSGPGYLKMGWRLMRKLPVGVLPAGPGSTRRMLTSRVPADLWSQPTQAGLDAVSALADDALASGLCAHAPAHGFRTDRNPDYLRWRTSFAPLHYRILLASDQDPAEGGLIFRLRKRGGSLEAVLTEQLTPDARTGARLVARMLKQSGADYAIGLRTGPAAGLVPLPGQGPVLMARPLAAGPPPAKSWVLTMGDVELF